MHTHNINNENCWIKDKKHLSDILMRRKTSDYCTHVLTKTKRQLCVTRKNPQFFMKLAKHYGPT